MRIIILCFLFLIGCEDDKLSPKDIEVASKLCKDSGIYSASVSGFGGEAFILCKDNSRFYVGIDSLRH